MSDSKKEKQIKKDEMANPETADRNSNDDFNEEPVDDYGVDMSKPGAAEEIQKRDDIKGGTGSRGEGRNANDNFAEGK